jgi:hypothetical protein
MSKLLFVIYTESKTGDIYADIKIQLKLWEINVPIS